MLTGAQLRTWARPSLGALRFSRPVWRYVAIVAYAAANIVLLIALLPHPNSDWAATWWWLPTWMADAELYEHTWRYSPLALPVLIPIIWAGPLALVGLHIAALALLARLGRVMFYAIAFSAFTWVDIAVGNMFTFVVVAAAFALRGSRYGVLAYLALTVLMPRPVQLPLLAWLVWTRPDARWPLVAMVGVSIAASGALGLLEPWVGALTGSVSEVFAPYSFGLSAIIGEWWFVLGVPLAILLTRLRWPALAGLMLSPYLLPQYLALAVVDVATHWSRPVPIYDSQSVAPRITVPMERVLSPIPVSEPYPPSPRREGAEATVASRPEG